MPKPVLANTLASVNAHFDSVPTDVGTRNVPLSSADIGEVERQRVLEALDSGWISGTGPHITEFERRLAERVDRSNVIAVANGTLAIELILRALDIGPGDEVIVPAFTFAAPAASVLAVGAKVVLVDVDEATWTLDPERVRESLSARTKAIIAVDVLGHPADFDALGQFGVPVIEDAAEAHGAHYKGRPCGAFGIASIFSFHANKAITTGEGGCVALDSAELAESMRTIVNHGMHPGRPYVHDVVGRNFRMTNLTASVGLGQLDRWEELLTSRRGVNDLYAELLLDVECTSRPVADWAAYSPWLYTVLVESRAEVLDYVRERGIDARAVWPTLSSQPVFGQPKDCPVAERVAASGIWLPTSSVMTSDDVRFVAETMAEAVARTRSS